MRNRIIYRILLKEEHLTSEGTVHLTPYGSAWTICYESLNDVILQAFNKF